MSWGSTLLSTIENTDGFQKHDPEASPRTHQAPSRLHTDARTVCSQSQMPFSLPSLQMSQASFSIQPKYCHLGEEFEVSPPL